MNGGDAMDAVLFSALAEPNRIRIVELLRDAGAMNLGEIAVKLGMRLPQSSKHLRVLADAGVVDVRAEANRRIFSLREERFAELDEWAQSFLKAKEAQFDRFEALLEKMQGKQSD